MNTLQSQSRLKVYLKRAAGWYSFAAITLCNTLLLFVLFNLALAAAFYFRGPDPGKPTNKTPTYPEATFQAVYPDFTAPERDQLLRETWTRPFKYDDFVHFRELPFQGKYVNVSEGGFRVSKNQGPWPLQSSNVNVFVFGGSTTFGYGLPDYQTVPSCLQEELSRALKRAVCIYNFGVGWYYSTQERIFLERLVSAGHKPDVAIFIDGFNECWRYDDTPPWRENFETALTPGARHAIESVIAPTPTGRLMRGLRRKMSQSNPNFIQDRNERIARQIDRYLTKKKLIDGMCRELSITPIFVWQPVPRYKYDTKYYLFPLPPGSYDEQLHGYGQMLKYFQQGLCGTNFLWCADIQQNERECLYVDQNHYTAKLSRSLAQNICEMALKAGLLDRYTSSRSMTNTAGAGGGN